MRSFAPLIFLFFAGPTWAGDFSSGSRGGSSAEFLTIGVGARSVSMGEAYSAVADEASALYWNPAAMTRIQGRSVTFMHSPYLDSSFLDYAAYGQNLGGRGAWGAGFQYFSAGGITQTDITGTDVGSFTPYDLALTLGYARRLDGFGPEALNGFSVGLAGKFIQSRILHTAQTGAVDIGILSPGYYGDRLRLALTASNLGGTLKFQQVSEDLPVILKAGSAYRISDAFLAAVDVALPKSDDPYVGLGTEYWLPTNGPWKFAGRAGFNSTTIGNVDGFTGVSFGIGTAYKTFHIDYGLVPFGGLGQAHRISLTYNFNR